MSYQHKAIFYINNITKDNVNSKVMGGIATSQLHALG